MKKNIVSDFVNKKVKIIYDDLGKPHFARGIISKVDEEFVILKGDYTDQMIRIDKIIKINYVRNNGGKK